MAVLQGQVMLSVYVLGVPFLGVTTSNVVEILNLEVLQ